MANCILQALPTADRTRLIAAMAAVSTDCDAVLFEPGQVIDAVHFPLTGVVALVGLMETASTVEVATVGNEGVVGVPLVAGGSLAVRAITAMSCTTLRMEASAFLEEVGHRGAFCAIIQMYTQALFGEISQAIGCNRLHSNEQRLSRWLLTAQDRAAVDDVAVTPAVLAQVLGSSQRTVGLTIDALVSAVLIRYSQGRVAIVDHPGLEAASCECYGVLQRQHERLVEQWPINP